MKNTGLLIILLGLLITISTLVFFSIGKKVVEVGKVNFTATKGHNLKWTPFIGIAVMGIGGVFVWQGLKKVK